MVTLATFDLLDKELTRKAKSFLAMEDEYRWDSSEVPFHLDPSYWDEFYSKINVHLSKFNWSEFKYSKYQNLNSVIATNDIGIYLFVVRPDNMILSLPQYVMYVGISGEKGSNRPLKDRLGDYFNIGNIRKRKKLHSMLNKYYNNTWVVYTTINKITSTELEQLEKDFHGFFIPPAAERDFPVKMKSIIKARFTR